MLDLILKKVCGLVGFCGPEHAFLHRPEQFCFPFMVEMREGVGRSVKVDHILSVKMVDC